MKRIPQLLVQNDDDLPSDAVDGPLQLLLHVEGLEAFATKVPLPDQGLGGELQQLLLQLQVVGEDAATDGGGGGIGGGIRLELTRDLKVG